MDAVSSIKTEDEGKTYDVPESCIASATDARSTVQTLIQAEEIRGKKRAKFKGMLNGNPPWPRLLREKGQGERANFTQREAEGFMAQAKTPYYALMFKTERFIQLKLEYGADAPAPLLQEWAWKISTRYQYLMDDWDGLDMNMQHSQYQMIGFGSGPIMWEDTEDWMSSSRNAGELMLPDDASVDIDKWDTAACRRSYLPTDLWKLVKNETAATANGMNVKAVKKAIMDAAPESMQKTYGLVWESYESEMRKGNTAWDSKSKRIFVADLFQKEFTGKISHFIVLLTPAETPISPGIPETGKDPIEGFLFRKIGRFKCFSEIVVPFIYDAGPDKQWHSVKGAGPKVFDFCSASDRLFCRGLDGAMKASGVIVQAKDSKALEMSAFTDVAGGTVIGPGYDVQQQRIAPNFESPLLMKRELGNTLSRNTGQYRAHFESEPAPTLGQQQMTAIEENALADGDVSRYYRQLDRFHRETLRRVLVMGKKLYAKNKNLAPDTEGRETQRTRSEELALTFYRNLVELDGVPEIILDFKNICRVKSTRLVGNGSNQMRQIVGNELMQMLPMADERGRNVILRNKAASIAGEDMADAIFPRYNTPQVVDEHVTAATMENNFLKMPNAELRVGPGQADTVHFGIHAESVAQHAQMVQAGQADPHALLIHLQQAGPHMAQHIKQISGDPTRKAQVQQMTQVWMGLSKMSDQLGQQVAAADQAAAQNQQPQPPDPALIAALTKVQGELKIKQMKMTGDMQLKAQKQDFTLKQKDLETAHEMKLANFEAVTSATPMLGAAA